MPKSPLFLYNLKNPLTFVSGVCPAACTISLFQVNDSLYERKIMVFYANFVHIRPIVGAWMMSDVRRHRRPKAGARRRIQVPVPPWISMVQCLCGPVTLWSSASVVQCLHGPVPLWSSASMVQCLYGPVPLWSSASMVQCPYGPVPQWSTAILKLKYNYPLLN